MHEIASIQGDMVYIKTYEGGIVSVPTSSIRYQSPSVGDKVIVFWDGQAMQVTPVQQSYDSTTTDIVPVHQATPLDQQSFDQQQFDQQRSHPQQQMPYAQQQPYAQQSYAQQQSYAHPAPSPQTSPYSQTPPQAYSAPPSYSAPSAATYSVGGGYGQQPLYTVTQPQYQQPTPDYAAMYPNSKVVTMNKNLFVWVFTFLLGFGIDRFIRGQIVLGIIKLLTAGGWGIWALVDWIIAMSKAYGSSFSGTEDFVFIDGQYAR